MKKFIDKIFALANAVGIQGPFVGRFMGRRTGDDHPMLVGQFINKGAGTAKTQADDFFLFFRLGR